MAPIIPLTEAFEHPHMKSPEVFVEHTREALAAWGIANVEELIASGAAVQPE